MAFSLLLAATGWLSAQTIVNTDVSQGTQQAGARHSYLFLPPYSTPLIMTTKQYWPLQAEKIDHDFRERFPPEDSRPSTRWSWDTDEGGHDGHKDTKRATVREVRGDDVEAKAGGDDDVVGSTSLYDENGKLRLIPVSTTPSQIRPPSCGLALTRTNT